MEQKIFLFTAIPLLGIVLVFGYLNIQQNSVLVPTESAVECKQIEYNGEDRIDLLFISSEEDAKHYTDYLFTVEPYKTYRDYFNVRVLNEEAECEYYKGIAILCYTNQVLDLAKKCEHDYVFVVKEDSKQIRSSAYGKVVSINKVHEDSVLVHEIGHALGNLAEEYVGAKIPSGSRNCVKACNDFKGEIDSCEQECSTSSHYRSIPFGVMRTLSTDNYGIYNINLITQLLDKNKPKDITITGNQISEKNDCGKEIITVEVNGNSVSTDNRLIEGCAYPQEKGLAGQLCIGNVCNINTLFTDVQEASEETLQGETYLNFNRNIPLKFYIKKTNEKVDVTLDNEVIATINTQEAGATACRA